MWRRAFLVPAEQILAQHALKMVFPTLMITSYSMPWYSMQAITSPKRLSFYTSPDFHCGGRYFETWWLNFPRYIFFTVIELSVTGRIILYIFMQSFDYIQAAMFLKRFMAKKSRLFEGVLDTVYTSRSSILKMVWTYVVVFTKFEVLSITGKSPLGVELRIRAFPEMQTQAGVEGSNMWLNNISFRIFSGIFASTYSATIVYTHLIN